MYLNLRRPFVHAWAYAICVYSDASCTFLSKVLICFVPLPLSEYTHQGQRSCLICLFPPLFSTPCNLYTSSLPGDFCPQGHSHSFHYLVCAGKSRVFISIPCLPPKRLHPAAPRMPLNNQAQQVTSPSPSPPQPECSSPSGPTASFTCPSRHPVKIWAPSSTSKHPRPHF